MHCDIVPGCIFACWFHIDPSPSVTDGLSPCDEARLYHEGGRLMSLEASLAAGTGECCPYNKK